jgi:hypothetical protein
MHAEFEFEKLGMLQALSTMMVPDDPGLHIMMNRRAITPVLDTKVGFDDPGHHNEDKITHVKEMPGTQSRKFGSTDPATSGMSTIMKMKKIQWSHLLYLLGSQNASTQRIQATSQPAEIRWIART